MENSKFGGSNTQLSIPARLSLLNGGERIDVTLKDGTTLSGVFVSYEDNKLKLTLVGTGHDKEILGGTIKDLRVPQITAKAR
ncbi:MULTISPECIES: hypothetical protein [Pseudomonas]|uniref:Uncharacterized protein n=1 Tax=Pseudomonas mandelii TaxID=75612 RepID=A0ABY0VL19_9PSED|nr:MULTISPECIES: hypothetical protein [Pseudomonas]OOL39635.1 hypothetical protein BOO94_01425 [Pseudomonas sp. FSL W5-0299]TWS05456.1 hypothetical protein FJD35_28305 [Pseudomonas mandelii]SDU38067.1 hypothetical protein SAMN04489801_2598 [Pseudomonas mandelii]